jgi:hypothetical protein
MTKQQKILSKLIQTHKLQIARKIIDRNNKEYTKKKFILPDLKKYKVEDTSNIILQTLRDKIKNSINNVKELFKPKVFNKTIRDKIKNDIKNKMAEYTKIDKKIGLPPYINNTIITEARAVINNVKYEYNKKLLELNPNAKSKKTWWHNSMSKIPRKGHLKVNGNTINSDEMFKVPVYEIFKSKQYFTGNYVFMRYPHDPNVDIKHRAGCNCEVEYKVV